MERDWVEENVVGGVVDEDPLPDSIRDYVWGGEDLLPDSILGCPGVEAREGRPLHNLEKLFGALTERERGWEMNAGDVQLDEGTATDDDLRRTLGKGTFCCADFLYNDCL